MKSMKESSPLQEMCPEKRLSNHSVRKTVLRKLKAKGNPKSEIITIPGHRQEQSVDAYDSGNEDEQRKPANIIDGKEIQVNQTTSRVPLQPLIQSSAAVNSGHVYNFHNCKDRLTLHLHFHDVQQAVMFRDVVRNHVPCQLFKF